MNKTTSNTRETATIPCSDEILNGRKVIACDGQNDLIHRQTSTSVQKSTNQSACTVTPVSSRPVSAGSLASIDSFQQLPSRLLGPNIESSYSEALVLF